MRIALLCSTVLALAAPGAGCGPAATPDAETAPAADPRAPTPLARAYPALARIPEGVTYVAVARRTADAQAALLELAHAVALVALEDVGAWRREWIALTGIDPLSPDDLAAAGIDLEASAAVYGDSLAPTLLLPIADRATVRAFLDERRPPRAALTAAGDVEVTSFSVDGAVRVAWAIAGDYLAVAILGDADGAADERRWAERLAPPTALDGDAGLAARAGLAAGGGGGSPPGVIGYVDLARLTREIARWVPEDAPCLGRIRESLGARAYLEVDVDWESARGIVDVALTEGAAASLADHVAASPTPGYLGYRDGSGLGASWAVDLDWLEDRRRALACRFAPHPIVGGGEVPPGGPLAYHVAIRHLDIDRRKARGAAHFATRDRRFARSLLDMLPGRNILERTRRVGDVKVRVINAPLLPRVGYRLEDRAFIVGVGKGVIEEIAPGRAATPAHREIASVAIRPRGFSDLSTTLRSLGRVTGLASPGTAQQTAARLRRYDVGRVDLRLRENTLRLSGSMRLRE